MRRWLGQVLPVVAIALLVQVLAPIGALRSVALTASDPFAFAPLCSGLHDPAVPATLPADGARDGACCAFCAGAPSGTAFAPPAAVVIAVQRQVHRVAWLPRGEASSRPHRARAMQARAPPLAA